MDAPVVHFQKRKALAAMEQGRFLDDVQPYERARLSLRLLSALAVAWTALVALYFAGWYVRARHPGSTLATPTAAATADVVFEMCSKGLLLAVLQDVHDTIFDEKRWAERKLRELWCMMSAVWKSSSDIIAVSVRRRSGAATVLVSPTLAQLERALGSHAAAGQGRRRRGDGGRGDGDGDGDDPRDAAAVVFELDPADLAVVPAATSSLPCAPEEEGRVRPRRVQHVQLGVHADEARISPGDPAPARREVLVVLAELLVRAWRRSRRDDDDDGDVVLVHDAARTDPAAGGRVRRVRCEAKVTRLDAGDVLLVVVRDVSDRYRRFRAEKVAAVERTARTRDAAANRFTRHEVKNGLLNAIGLCDQLREREAEAEAADASETVPGELDVHQELDLMLHEVLGTCMGPVGRLQLPHTPFPLFFGVQISSILPVTTVFS